MGREKQRQRLAIKKAFTPRKKVQQHTKQHKFESFSHRVARLRIDPIRRDRGRHDEQDLQVLQSHFRLALEKWRDLNLSEDFTKFDRLVDKWSNSLPQVVHHQDKIADLLLEYVEKSTAVSAEPLLDLVAHLAQDLQAQFADKHFERTIKCVAGVAATHQEVEVVEWSFNCLTWLFKYLERILAADIYPLYDILAPYLGKERQKPFVSRFAAESLSFLVKRVGKRKDATTAFVKYALQDLEETAKDKDVELYEHSLTALFLEAIKSTKEALHSTGSTIFCALLDQTLAIQQNEGATDSSLKVIREIFHQLLHHTSAENIEPLLDTIYAAASSEDLASIDAPRMVLTSQLLLLASSVKGGHRVTSWSNLLKHLRSQIDLVTQAGPTNHKNVAIEVLATLAVAHQKCPLDAALSSLGTLDMVCGKQWQTFFPGFCSLYAEQRNDRFKSFLLPRLQKFLTSSWDGVTRPLAVLVPKLVQSGAVTPRILKLAEGHDELIIESFKNNASSANSEIGAQWLGHLDILDSAAYKREFHSKVLQQVSSRVRRCIKNIESSPTIDFDLGGGFMHVAENTGEEQMDAFMPGLLPYVANTAQKLTNFPIFFQALVVAMKKYDASMLAEHPTIMQELREVLYDCLPSSSHDIRLACLEMLVLILPSDQADARKELANAIDVEGTEPNIESMRYISMKIKNLGMHYASLASNSPILAQAIPRWLFGMLHVKLSHTWEDACNALKEISETKQGEEVVSEIAFKWLSNAPLRDEPTSTEAVAGKEQQVVPDDYFSQLRGKMMEPLTFADRADEILLEHFEEKHKRIQLLTPFNRAQALRVLKAVPSLAEKKSRQLVPVLLSWNGETGNEEAAEESDDSPATVQNTIDEQQKWPRKDQKALLGLFAGFGNPKVLYKADEVYSTLLSLLAHGDAEIQKSALQAVLAWKDKTLRKHSDELFKFLDGDRLREQLSIFLDNSITTQSGDGEASLLPAEDRPTVMPIVLRLVYGRIIARSRNERGSNRKAVFVILAKFSVDEIETFLDVMLAPIVGKEARDVPLKRQLGMLNMIKDLLETWKSTASPYVSKLAPAVHTCLIGSAATVEGEVATAMTKAVRSIAMQCLNLCFEASNDTFDWTPFIPSLFDCIIDPRMDKFAEENAHGVSAMMRMFSIWASKASLVRHLFERQHDLILKVAAILSLAHTKEQVVRFVLNDVLRQFIGHADMDEDVEAVVKQKAGMILNHLANLLGQSTLSKEVVEDAVTTILVIMPHTTACPTALLSDAAKLVQQPAKKVPHRTKTELLSIIVQFFTSLQGDHAVSDEVFAAVCASFAYFADGKSRSLLVDIAKQFAQEHGSLDEVITLLDGINAFVPGRLDLPDYDRRSEAFATITETKWRDFTAKQWRLLLGNLLFYIKDEEELAIRASASHALRRFVEASAAKADKEKEQTQDMLKQLLASIERGLKKSPQLVQVELLSVLAEVAKLPEHSNPVWDMRHLLMDGDEEANLFNNLLHVQQHRRVRAMNRLASLAAESGLSSRNLYRFLVPLLEWFIFTSGDGVLMAEAMKALGLLVEWLDWQQFRVVVQRYTSWVKSKEDKQETVLKLLDGVVSGLSRSAAVRASSTAHKTLTAVDADEDMEDEEEAPVTKHTALSRTMPGPEKMSHYITEEALPPLSVFLREKDESFVSRRISVALIAAKFIQLLQGMDFQVRFPPLLTDVCNILRSKDQGSRDMTRRALSSMLTLIGPSAFGFILRELRSALTRGFYLHVLAFSVHSVLESTVATFQPGDLDYCVEDIVDVIVEDVFGNTGKEKDIAEYKADKQTKKEVKGKKSFDTMQLVASVTSLGNLVQLVRPVQALLAGHLSVKEVRYVDELLRRVELGVLQNESLKNRDVLLFCYEIVQEALKQTPPPEKKRMGRKPNGGLVESAYLKPAVKKYEKTSLHSAEASGKIVRFALEMVRSVLKKNKELLTANNLSGFLPVIGDALLNTNEDVKLAAIRLFTSIINVPISRIDDDAPVYIAEAARIVEESHSNGSELEQASLKLISAILRERKSAPVKVRSKTISILLKRLKGDLQVISQQGAAFNLLRSIIGRQIIVPELYEIMDGDDGVAAIAVRDHDRITRDLARSVYFQFLMDCPQGEKRWAKQLAFVKGNLDYEYPEGRKSVMDIVHLLLSKVGDELVADVVKEVFWPLVGSMVNDADADCRDVAGRLVKQIFGRASEEWTQTYIDLAQRLLKQGNAVQKRTALQSWRLYLEVKKEDVEGLDFVLEAIVTILEPLHFDVDKWQVMYWALHTFASIVQSTAESAFTTRTKSIWSDARRYMNFPHLWVKQQATTLFGLLFENIAATNDRLDGVPLRASGVVTLKASELCDLTHRHLRLLSEGVTRELADLVVHNLTFLGKAFASNQMKWHSPGNDGALAVKEPSKVDEELEDLSGGEMKASAEFESHSAMEHLLSQLGMIMRREFGKPTTPGPRQESALIPKTAALQLLAALCTTLPDIILQASAETIVSPLVHLTSSDLTITSHTTVDFKSAHEELVKHATELQDLLREKLGTTEFVQVLQRVKTAQRERREGRRAKRQIDTIARPDIMAKKKARRVEREKDRRKEKNEFHRGRRRGW